MKAVAVCILALLGLVVAPMVRAADAPSLSLDLGRSQDLKIDARHVPLEQLLNELGQHLNFTVDFSPLADRAAIVSGKFEGNLDELLSEILSNANYVAERGPRGVSHLVVIAASKTTGAPATAAAAGQPVAVDVKSGPQPASATAQAAPPAGFGGQPLGAAAGNNPAGNPAGPPSVVSKLLQSQANAMLADPNAGSTVPAGGTQSLGVMTRVAQSNVQALVAALNAACIGSACPH